LKSTWVEPDIRDEVVETICTLVEKTDIPAQSMLRSIGVPSSTFYTWKVRLGVPNNHSGAIPKLHWILPWEQEAIITYAKAHPGEGYRRLTYQMIDADVVAVSPSTVYRVLRKEGLLNRWNQTRKSAKGNGFVQPTEIHQHWHIDIKYVNFKGTFLFLISIIDGFSRYIVHHELRQNMQEYDVQLTIQTALEKFPGVNPRMISDNGSQFIAKDFTEFMRAVGLKHIKTSIAYPQSNGKIERFHRTISEECLRTTSFFDPEDAKSQISHYITHYNTKRLNSAIFYLTPEDLLLGRMNERLEERQRKLDQAYQLRMAKKVA
jgi:putative transposase